MAPTRRIRWHLAWALALWLPLQALAYDQNRVATDDGLVEIGAPDLPLPAQALAAGQPVFYDARYMDQPVRVGALRRAMATTGYTELKEFQRVEVVVQ